MNFKTEKRTALLLLFSHLLIIKSQALGKSITVLCDIVIHLHDYWTADSGYYYITQPPSDLPCDPHSSDSDESSLWLECSIGLINSDSQLPADIQIVWYRSGAPNSTEELQLCENDVRTSMVSSPALKSGLRSVVRIQASSEYLIGDYWCQITKTNEDGRALLSNRSSVLSVHNSQYYRNQSLPECKPGTIFLDISTFQQSIRFSSSLITQRSSPLTVPHHCSEPTTGTSTDGTNDADFVLPRMWVYILAPVIATVLIIIFVLLLIALVTTCIQKRDTKKRHTPTIGMSLLLHYRLHDHVPYMCVVPNVNCWIPWLELLVNSC